MSPAWVLSHKRFAVRVRSHVQVAGQSLRTLSPEGETVSPTGEDSNLTASKLSMAPKFQRFFLEDLHDGGMLLHQFGAIRLAAPVSCTHEW